MLQGVSAGAFGTEGSRLYSKHFHSSSRCKERYFYVLRLWKVTFFKNGKVPQLHVTAPALKTPGLAKEPQAAGVRKDPSLLEILELLLHRVHSAGLACSVTKATITRRT